MSGDDNGEWVEAGQLRIGDEIRRADGLWAKVEWVGTHNEGAKVYNFEVVQNHNYFAGYTGLLVHNNCAAAEIAKRVIAKFGTLECKPCQNALIRELKAAGIKARRVELRSSTSFIMKNGVREPVSTNGRHFGVKVGDTVFDNFHPEGVSYGQWKNAFETAGMFRRILQ